MKFYLSSYKIGNKEFVEEYKKSNLLFKTLKDGQVFILEI